MVDPQSQDPLDDREQDLESMMDRFEQFDPSELGKMNPEQIQKLLGGAKLGDIFAKIQQQARALADELGDQDDEDDWLDDEADWFDDETEAFDDDDRFFQRPSQPDGSFDDFPGSQELWDAASKLDPEERLEVSIEIKSPPMTDVEKVYYHVCHYRLIFDLFDAKMTFRDVATPRQDYLHGAGWPAMLNLPRKAWPKLTPLWDTIKVEQYNLREALRSNNHPRQARPDLADCARQALQSALGD